MAFVDRVRILSRTTNRFASWIGYTLVEVYFRLNGVAKRIELEKYIDPKTGKIEYVVEEYDVYPRVMRRIVTIPFGVDKASAVNMFKHRVLSYADRASMVPGMFKSVDIKSYYVEYNDLARALQVRLSQMLLYTPVNITLSEKSESEEKAPRVVRKESREVRGGII